MRRDLWISLTIVLLTLVVFGPVGGHEFIILDDPDYVTENPVVQAGLSKESLRWAFTTGHAANWHPLTWASHMLDCRWFGLQPAGHHWVNVVLHAAAAVLLFLALARMTAASWPSALVAALFAWHPLHVESVAWIAERKDILSGLFWMATLLCYAWYAERSGKAGFARYLAVLGCFALGLLSKPMVVTLPFVLLLLDWWPLKRFRDRRSVLRLPVEKLPLLALSVAASVVTLAVQSGAGATAAMERLTLSERLGNGLVAYVRYLGKTFWPADLAVYYPHPGRWPVLIILGAALLLIAITAAVIVVGRSRRYAMVGWAWYLGTLVPVIGLVQVGSQSAADRYTYLPLVGLFVIFAWGVADWVGARRQRRSWAGVACAVILAACLFGTATQLRHWRNSIVLFERALEVTGDNIAAHVNLGHALLQRDDVEGAATHYEAALRLNPDLPDALSALGLIRADQGRLQEAFDHYIAALRLEPGLTEARNNLGILLARAGRLDDAVEQFREGARLDSASITTLLNLTRVLAARGDREEALVTARRAHEIAARTGQHDQAAMIEREIERLRRGNASP